MISVIIPTKNRLSELLGCLRGLSAQDTPSLLREVIVIDDRSREPYNEKVVGFAQANRLPLSYICDFDGTGAAQARNYGAKRARGRILAFLDDDSIPEVNWLQIIAHRISQAGVSAVTGRILPRDQQRLLSNARQLKYETRQNNALINGGPVRFFAAGNAAILKEDFEQMGGFDVSYLSMHGAEIVQRLRQSNKFCFYVHDLLVYHRHYKGLTVAVRQAFGSAYYRIRLEEQYGAVEPLSFPQQVRSRLNILSLSKRETGRYLPGVAALSMDLMHGFGYLWYKSRSWLGTRVK